MLAPAFRGCTEQSKTEMTSTFPLRLKLRRQGICSKTGRDLADVRQGVAVLGSGKLQGLSAAPCVEFSVDSL